MSADGSHAPAMSDAFHAAPHNLEAEQALLGAILFDNEAFNRIGDRLKAHHFYDPVHGRIFAVCSDLIGRGKLADGLTLREWFQREGGLQEIGGAGYLLVLMENAARLTTQARDYADLVYDLALRRELIRIGGEITGLAATPPEDMDAQGQIEEAERKLFTLAESGTGARGFSAFNVALTRSIETAAAAYESGGGVSGLATGFRDIDKKIAGLHKSDLVILAGRPAMGKTALATNIAFNVANARLNAQNKVLAEGEKPEGGIVAFFSLEMSAEQLATRLLSDFSQVESYKIRSGEINAQQYEQLIDASARLQALPLHIDDTGGISISHLMARARRLQRTHGLDLIVVDYLQLVTASSRRSEGRVQEVSEITQSLKALAKDLDVPVIALSQLSRQVEARDNKRPQLADLRESGSIEQDADIVMFVYRDEYYLKNGEPKPGSDEHMTWQRDLDSARNKAELIIGKQRHGSTGTIHLSFEGAFTRFGDLDEQPQSAYDE
ncbi:MAG: replicative DNA helicase [Hyphomonadaceae bacterium]|nr:replicative DNA helicase [Hyphomonadaceae bacterium]